MSKNKTTKWLIVAQTNLHVGSESISGMEIADKTVQRDVLTKFPCINASSLKGAINEFCCREIEMDANEVFKIFGDDKLGRVKEPTKNGKEKRKDSQKGQYIFNDAQLLLLPVPDEDILFHWETTDAMLKNAGLTEEQLRDKLSHPLKNQPIIRKIEQKDFAEKCENELPIIARNHLDDGKSVNLFYEEVVPSQAVFITTIIADDTVLEAAIDGKIIQIGAGATIGRGYCKFIKIS
ncbi:MAG: RAMP superfamily CRISPR-associated protein [Bacteroidales bacterium]|jgi:CRISPR-associated protein Cmr4|nr:RAMP superfamily CRISPR-associated protein [Bacteroidales bacterium]